MATALDMITRSLLTLGVLGIGEVPDSDLSAIGLIKLNEMLGSWSNENLMAYKISSSASFTMDGSTYAFQLSPRLDCVTNAVFSINNVDYPVLSLTDSQFLEISNKTLTASIVTHIYHIKTYPNAYIQIYPIPATGTLTVYGLYTFAPYTALTDTISFPPGYEAAIVENLADAMQSICGKNRPKVTADARKLKADIKRRNHRSMVINTDFPTIRNNSYIIQRGY